MHRRSCCRGELIEIMAARRLRRSPFPQTGDGGALGRSKRPVIWDSNLLPKAMDCTRVGRIRPNPSIGSGVRAASQFSGLLFRRLSTPTVRHLSDHLRDRTKQESWQGDANNLGGSFKTQLEGAIYLRVECRSFASSFKTVRPCDKTARTSPLQWSA